MSPHRSAGGQVDGGRRRIDEGGGALGRSLIRSEDVPPALQLQEAPGSTATRHPEELSMAAPSPTRCTWYVFAWHCLRLAGIRDETDGLGRLFRTQLAA